MIAGVLVYVRLIEKRRFTTLGFRREHALREYLSGLGIGLVMFTAVVGICAASGALSFEGFALGSIGMLLLFFVGFMIQGLSEELLCRGYFLVSLARRQSLGVALALSSICFALLHVGNSGVFDTPLPLINLAGFGVFAGIYFIKRGSIWGVAAIHSIWNFAQGNLFGLSVSGADSLETVFRFSSSQSGIAPLINGGTFGPEGGLAVTVVLAIGIIVTLLMKTKPSELTPAEGAASPLLPPPPPPPLSPPPPPSQTLS
jgi:membrane protease YdiL (CAAX protease family)